MSALNMRLHIGSFQLNIKLDRDVKTKDTDLGRKWEYENRINNAVEKGKDTHAKYRFINILL